MGTRFRLLAAVLLPASLLVLSACSSGNNSAATSGIGAFYVTTQGDSLVTGFTIDLSTGVLSANGSGVATGNTPSAMIMAPSGAALFVSNSAANTISAYTVKSDGTLTAASGTPATGMTPVGMAIDSGGHFLFVANQGQQIDAASGSISVFAIQDTTLTPVSGSPFSTAAPLAPFGTGPSAVAVTPDAKFLYVTNQFDNTVTEFSVDGSGVLTRLIAIPVGTAPSTATISPDGGFLYVGNSGSSNLSAFAVCNQVLSSCSNPTSPDGSLTPVTNSPFSVGLDPSSIVFTPDGQFLFVVNRRSNEVSEFKVSTGTGALTANTQATISTGGDPVWGAVRVGTTVISATGGTTNFLYVANLGSSSVSVYSFDSTIGTLSQVGSPVSTGGFPSAAAVK
jgi:6-phosphogluconolactonase (cycloisomerase 2 family)